MLLATLVHLWLAAAGWLLLHLDCFDSHRSARSYFFYRLYSFWKYLPYNVTLVLSSLVAYACNSKHSRCYRLKVLVSTGRHAWVRCKCKQATATGCGLLYVRLFIRKRSAIQCDRGGSSALWRGKAKQSCNFRYSTHGCVIV